MVLGVYWYFGFPQGLYKYDYFVWKQGYGGHADNPASLEVTVLVKDPERIIDLLSQLIKKYNQGFIFIYRNGKSLKIGTGSWHLFDYDFQLMLEVEKILKQENVVVVSDDGFKDGEIIRLQEENSQEIIYPKKKIVQLVGSSMKKSNAEASMLRMDCFLPLKNKVDFLVCLEELSKEEKINVLFYNQKRYADGINLMVFFSNGRQWLNVNGRQTVDAVSLENKLESLQNTFQLAFKHEGGWDYYPIGETEVVKMVDREFLL